MSATDEAPPPPAEAGPPDGAPPRVSRDAALWAIRLCS